MEPRQSWRITRALSSETAILLEGLFGKCMITYKTKEVRTKLDDISRKMIIIMTINLLNFTSRIARVALKIYGFS